MPGAFTDEGGSSRRPTEEVVERLRSALLAAHYDEVGISEATGTPVGYTFPITESAVDLRRVIGGDRLHNLIRLFLCGGTISGASAAEALGELSLNEGAKAGLIKLGGDQVSSPVRIHAWRNLLIASDRGRQAPDLVTGVNPAAITLANLTIRADAEKTLDLGTGCGIQARPCRT